MTVSRQAAVAARFESSMLLVLLLSLALGCGGDGGTGPTVGRIGPFPAGLTGKVALLTLGVITSGSVSYTQTKVHVIDLAREAGGEGAHAGDGIGRGPVRTPTNRTHPMPPC